jgi:AcrR family transcriptional regulator
MPDQPVNPGPPESARRPYHSPGRAHGAEQTRARIVAAARSLFLGGGYFPTTVRAIADVAGVAEKTVYLAFPGKAALLDAVIDAAISGPDRSALAQSQPQAAIPGTPLGLLHTFSQAAAGIMERTARVLAMAEAAATIDPELAAHRARGHTAMRQRFEGLAAALSAHGALREDVSQPRAAATIYALANDSVYLRLAEAYGWSTTDYARWLEDILTHALIKPTKKRRRDTR